MEQYKNLYEKKNLKEGRGTNKIKDSVIEFVDSELFSKSRPGQEGKIGKTLGVAIASALSELPPYFLPSI